VAAQDRGQSRTVARLQRVHHVLMSCGGVSRRCKTVKEATKPLVYQSADANVGCVVRHVRPARVNEYSAVVLRRSLAPYAVVPYDVWYTSLVSVHGTFMLDLDGHRSGRHFLQIPGPTNVPDRVLRAIDRPTIDHRGPEFARLARSVLGGMKKVFRTQGDVVIYPASGTGAG
jgi:hypothetical protein